MDETLNGISVAIAGWTGPWPGATAVHRNFSLFLSLTNILFLIVTLLLQATVEYDLALQPFKRPQDEEYLKVNLVAIFLNGFANTFYKN